MATPLPDNRARFTAGDLARHTGGVLVAGHDEAPIEGVVSDSRRVAAGTCFVALRGERFDGHSFAAEALRLGASAVVVERSDALPRHLGAVVEVPDTLRALGDLGLAARARWGKKVIAVAGSAGKTTTTQAVASVLRELVGPSAVHATSGNLNNRVGVPHVLLALEPSHELAVIELGTNAPGEVAELVRITRPDVGVLTLVGVEHSEGLGDLDGIEEEEAQVFAGLGPSGIAIGNADDERVARRLRACRTVRSYGLGAPAAVRGEVLTHHGELGTRLAIGSVALHRDAREVVAVDVALPGRAGVYAALAAFAVAEAVTGACPSGEVVTSGLAQAQARQEGRLVARPTPNGGLVIDDSYNANPPSMMASIELARAVAQRRGAPLALVLGEMRELGALSAAEHAALGDAAAAAGAALLAYVGGDARLAAERSEALGAPARFFATSDEAALALPALLPPSAVVLVKGSRGVRTERVVTALAAPERATKDHV